MTAFPTQKVDSVLKFPPDRSDNKVISREVIAGRMGLYGLFIDKTEPKTEIFNSPE